MVKNLPATAGDMGLINNGAGRFHKPQATKPMSHDY